MPARRLRLGRVASVSRERPVRPKTPHCVDKTGLAFLSNYGKCQVFAESKRFQNLLRLTGKRVPL